MDRPIIYMTILFITGIIFASIVDVPFWLISILIVILFIAALSGIFLLKNAKIAYIILFGLILMLGAGRYQLANLVPKNDISRFAGKSNFTVVGQIMDEPGFSADSAFFGLRVMELRRDGKTAKTSGQIKVVCRRANLEYGDTVELSGALRQLQTSTNPDISSYDDYLMHKGINYELKANRAPPRVIKKGGNPFVKFSFALRSRLLQTSQETIPEPYNSLFCGLIFGSRVTQLSAETKEIYKRAGISHLLCASGMNIGILVGVVLVVCKFLRLPLSVNVFAGSLVNIIYVFMSGCGPSILRAAVMAQLMLLALLFERDKDFYTAFSISALVLLVLDPRNIFDAGFQLSFAATWAVVIIAPVFAEQLKKFMPEFVALMLSVSLAPVLTTTPITMYHFSQLSFVALLTNLAVLPWVDNLIVLGFASSALGLIFRFGAEILNGANLVLMIILDLIARFSANLPGSFAYVRAPTLPLVIGYYIGLWVLLEILKGTLKIKFGKQTLSLISLFLLSILVCHVAASEVSVFKNELIISVLDVGQGDSILVESPSGKRMLVDGGEERMGRSVLVPVLNKKGINKIDVLVLTHPHDDHVGGLPYVLKNIKTDLVLDIGVPHTSPGYREFLRVIQNKKIPYKIPQPGWILDLGNRVSCRILAPSAPYLSGTNSDLNNNSIVMRLEYKKFSMLLTGDAEKEEEERILETITSDERPAWPARFAARRAGRQVTVGVEGGRITNDESRATILKVGHHGSSTSSSQEFLDMVQPKYAVISVGKYNKFGHPNFGTIKRLEGGGAKVYRTDRGGAVVVRTDGERIKIKEMRIAEGFPESQDSRRVPRVSRGR